MARAGSSVRSLIDSGIWIDSLKIRANFCTCLTISKLNGRLALLCGLCLLVARMKGPTPFRADEGFVHAGFVDSPWITRMSTTRFATSLNREHSYVPIEHPSIYSCEESNLTLLTYGTWVPISQYTRGPLLFVREFNTTWWPGVLFFKITKFHSPMPVQPTWLNLNKQ